MKYFLLRRVYASWLIASVCVGIFCGVALAPAVAPGWFDSVAWLLTGTALCLTVLWQRYAYLVIIALAGGVIIGLWRGSVEQSALRAYNQFYGKPVIFTGTVSDDPEIDKRGNTVIRLKDVMYRGAGLPGVVWVSVPSDELPAKRSDTITVSGELEKGFGTFVGSIYRAEMEKISRPEPGDIALRIRDWFAGLVRTAIPEPEASLGIGYLVGQRRTLPDELDMALKIAGLTHIVVASGYNLTILVRLARRLFEKVSKYLSLMASGGMIAAFVAVTGLSPSMSRAGLIAGLSLLAWYYGRKFHPLVLLPFAVAVTVLVNPSYAWGDVGWQLSFAAFAGVMILAPLLQAFYFGQKKPGTLRQILGETIAATLCTLPILLYTFGYISNIAIVANLLILPLVPLAMLLVFVAGIGAFLFAGIATAFGFPAYLLLTYMTQTVDFFATLPWAVSELTVELWHVALMYIALITFAGYMWWKTRLNLRDTNLVE